MARKSDLLAALTLLIATTTGVAPEALAESSPTCTLEPQSKWLPESEMRERA